MRTVFIILAVLVALFIALVAMINDQVVTVNYLFGQVDLNLFTLIIGSALAGVLVMVFFNIYRSIHNYIKSQGDRGHRKELQRRIKVLEDEKRKLEIEVSKLQRERQEAASKTQAELEAEKKKLEEEVNKQQKEREGTLAQEQRELESEKKKLEDELKKQQKETENLKAQSEPGGIKKKGLFSFLKK